MLRGVLRGSRVFGLPEAYSVRHRSEFRYICFPSGAVFICEDTSNGSWYVNANPQLVLQNAFTNVDDGDGIFIKNGNWVISAFNAAVSGGLGFIGQSDITVMGESWRALIQQAIGQNWEPLVEISGGSGIRFTNLGLHSRSTTATGECLDFDSHNDIKVDRCSLLVDTGLDDGVTVHADAANISDVNISLNKFVVHGTSINMFTSASYIVSRPTILANQFVPTVAVGHCGVGVSLTTRIYDAIIAANHFGGSRTFTADDIYLSDVRACIIANNILKGYQDGVDIASSFRIQANDNIFRDCAVGLRIGAGCTGQAQDNIFQDCAAAVVNAAPTTFQTQGNTGNCGWWQSADYGVAWAGWLAAITGTPSVGQTVMFYNTNGAGSYRMATYLNGAWRYEDLT